MIIFDIEADNLLDEVTKVHIIGWTTDGKEVHTTTDPQEFLKVLDQHDFAGAHNSFRYDFPLLKKLFGYEYRGTKIDTLWLSWCLDPKRTKHGLGDYGNKVEVDKDQWADGDYELMKERVVEDVKINYHLWEKQRKMLEELYGEFPSRFLRYIEFKGDCAAYQEQHPILLDMDLAVSCRDTLEQQQREKVEQLKEVMPKVPMYVTRKPPKITHKKDGTPTKKFDEWLDLLRSEGYPPTHKEPIRMVKEYKEPNPNSNEQVKAWLYSLGWKPCTFKYERDKETGDERKIEQVRKDGELTPSVLTLKDKDPSVEILEGLTVIQHRLGVFKGFIESALKINGKYYLKAEIAGLTNTMRFKHKKPLVNLPGVNRPWGEEIRSCLIADDGETFIGADMTSLEDTTRRHYISPLDPGLIAEESEEGFDPHLRLAVEANMIEEGDYKLYKKHKDDPAYQKDIDRITAIRKKAKVVTYSAVYGVGKAKLARETGMSVKEAEHLLEAFWRRNWAVKKVAEQQYTKEVGGYTWLKNPVSGFWHELRYDKDKWSTTNQSTAVYVFDSWLARARLYGYTGQGQFHDETLASVKDEKSASEALTKGIERLNSDLQLNVDFGIDIKTGRNYSEVH